MYDKLRVLDLFSGIGGFSLGLERTGGFETVAFCEIEPFCQKVLKKHWPEVPQYDDVRTLTGGRLSADGVTVDVITGGFPCQDISTAGKLSGIKDGTRSGLWSEIVRLACEIRPRYILIENVSNLLIGPSERPGGWFSRILCDLASIGYDAEWQDISAEDIGAPHSRSRIWIVAYPMREGLERLWITEWVEQEISKSRHINDDSNAAFISGIHSVRERGLCAVIDSSPDRPRWAGQQWPETEPLLCRVGDGIPDRVGRTSACGNAVVPQIPEIIGRAILKAENEH